MEKDGFGSVVCSEHQLIEKLRLLLEDRFVIPSKYRKRVDDFFTYHYNKNCERIYSSILTMLGKYKREFVNYDNQKDVI